MNPPQLPIALGRGTFTAPEKEGDSAPGAAAEAAAAWDVRSSSGNTPPAA